MVKPSQEGGKAPVLTVLLPAKLGYSSILPALSTWDAQRSERDIEVIILCPDGCGPSPEEAQYARPWHRVVMTGSLDLHQMRVLGLEHAHGEYVVLAEDHCLPDPDFCDAVIRRFGEGWDAVGPSLRPGVRESVWAQASFLIGYGEWILPDRSRPTDVLCGWNGTVRTSLLRDLGPELAPHLLVGAFAVRHLRQRGARFFLDADARMRHFDPPGFGREMELLLIVGLGFGAMRTRTWSRAARLLYPLGAPAWALMHWRRALVHYVRAGRAAGLSLSSLGAAAVLALAWGIGEAAGAVRGIDRVSAVLWKTEVKPVSWAAIAASDARDQITRMAQRARSTG
jgi:hypothetical protein